MVVCIYRMLKRVGQLTGEILMSMNPVFKVKVVTKEKVSVPIRLDYYLGQTKGKFYVTLRSV